MRAAPPGPDAEDLQLHLFKEYLAYQEETGYDGSFEDFVFRGDPTGQVQQEIDEQVEAALAADTSEHVGHPCPRLLSPNHVPACLLQPLAIFNSYCIPPSPPALQGRPPVSILRE